MKEQMMESNFDKSWQKLMETIDSIQTIPIKFERDAIKRSSVKDSSHNFGGFPDRVEWIPYIRQDSFSSFHRVPITKSSHHQLPWIEHTRQFESHSMMMHEM
jgi:hypothetical protein